MSATLTPWSLVVVAIAGWINREQEKVTEYVLHYHQERPHQGLENRLITHRAVSANSDGEVQRRERLGGLLSYYHREAA